MRAAQGFWIAAAIVTATASTAMAQPQHPSGGLGFRTSSAPVGLRWWLSDTFAIDAGVGFSRNTLNYFDIDDAPAEETFTSYSFDVGVPIRLKSWDQVHFIARPGFFYTSEDDEDTFLFSDGEFTAKSITWVATAELEVEIFIAKAASISASHGIGFRSEKLDYDDPDLEDLDPDTIFGTFGDNFTTLGFHVYLWPAGGE